MILLVCATPYHVICSLNLAKEQSSDIVLFNHFSDAIRLKEKLEELRLFKNVFFVDENNYSVKGKCKRLFHTFVPCKTIRDIANKTYYEKIVFFALDFLNFSYIIKKYKRREIMSEYYFGDDGIGTYSNSYIYHPSKITSILLHITNRYAILDKINKIYVNMPELISDKKYRTFKINNNEIGKEMEQLWPFYFEQKPPKYIYLQEPFPDIDTLEDEIINILNNYIGIDNYKIKLHPRQYDWHIKQDNIINTTFPFERIAKDSRMGNCTIISFSSTAAITAALMQGNKIDIIFLYKLSPITMNYNHKLEEVCVQLREKYEINIMQPNNLEEFEEILINKSSVVK